MIYSIEGGDEMERSAIIERDDPDSQWQATATVPELPAEFATWPIDTQQVLRIVIDGTSMEVNVALRNRPRGNPGSCLIVIRHNLFLGDTTRLVVNPDGKGAIIEKRQVICHRGPGGPGLEKRYCVE